MKCCGSACGAGLLVGPWAAHTAVADEKSRGEPKKEEKEEIVSPAEDLMREHGVLNRILLIYEESGRRLLKPDFDPEPLAQSAQLVRRFVEDYHEKLEEDHLFPRFKEANKLMDLVEVLRRQHEAGRKLTDRITSLATPTGIKADADRQALQKAVRQFIRMYWPHESREDTVLFPAFQEIVPSETYWALGEDFEHKEHELFGDEGFHGIVEQVAQLEKKLGIYDLDQFTPRV